MINIFEKNETIYSLQLDNPIFIPMQKARSVRRKPSETQSELIARVVGECMREPVATPDDDIWKSIMSKLESVDHKFTKNK